MENLLRPLPETLPAHRRPAVTQIRHVLHEQSQSLLIPTRRRHHDRVLPPRRPQSAQMNASPSAGCHCHGYCPVNPASRRTSATLGPTVALTEEPRPLLALPARQHRLEHHTGRIKGNHTLSHLPMRRTRQISHPGHATPVASSATLLRQRGTSAAHLGKNLKHATPAPPETLLTRHYTTPGRKSRVASNATRPKARTRSPSARRAAASPTARPARPPAAAPGRPPRQPPAGSSTGEPPGR